MSVKCIRNAFILSAIMWGCIFLIYSTAHAQVTVAWDTYAAQSEISEFRIYVATTPGGFQFPIKVTPVSLTQYTIPASAITTNTSYIRMTAYGINGLESDPSNEVIYTKPTTTTTAAIVTTSIRPTTTTTSVAVPPPTPSNLRIVPQ